MYERQYSEAELKAMLDYLRDKQCALCGILHRCHETASHPFYELGEDIPMEERQ
jgi:hypothetical protein